MLLSGFIVMALLAKWAVYIGFAAVVGGLFMLNLVRQQPKEAAVLRHYIASGAALGLVAVAVNYLAQVGSFAGDGVAGMFDGFMHELLWFSPIGESVLWRVAGFGLVLLGSRLILSTTLKIRQLAWAIVLSGTVLLATAFSTLGHSTELNFFSQSMVFLHVVIIGSWVGAFYPLWRLCSVANVKELQLIMDKFGQLGIGIVALVVVSGGSLLWQLFDKPSEFITSGYGQAMLLKLSLVCVILLIAARHKFILVPSLTNQNDPIAARKLQKSIALEVVVGVLILATTAVLSSVLGPVSLS